MNESADGYSGFDGTNLAQLLKEEDVNEVWVGGLATDYCVKHTVLDAVREGFEVKALADSMRAVNKSDDGAKQSRICAQPARRLWGMRARPQGSRYALLRSAFS
jgi:nicotinamidase-related amidase